MDQPLFAPSKRVQRKWSQEFGENEFIVMLGGIHITEKACTDILEGSEWTHNHLQKILEKIRKLRKSCNHKRNIFRIYNKKLHYNCLRWGGPMCPHKKKKKKLGNSGNSRDLVNSKHILQTTVAAFKILCTGTADSFINVLNTINQHQKSTSDNFT